MAPAPHFRLTTTHAWVTVPAMAMLQVLCAAAAMAAAATATAANGGAQLRVACDPGNDLFKLLSPRLGCTAPDTTAAAAVTAARAGDTVPVLADGYPNTPTAVPPAVFAAAQAKRLQLFVEFPAALPGGLTIAPGILAGNMAFAEWSSAARGSFKVMHT